MHSCPDCQEACYCDMEDHESSAPINCTHECEGGDDIDDDSIYGPESA